jgi:hypothetical protein
MSTFYLTNIKEIQKETKQRPKSQTIRKKRKSSLDDFIERNQELHKTKQNFLDYIINEQTQYADLEKIEDYYKSITVNNHDKYNKEQALLDTKMKELDKLTSLVHIELIQNVNFTQDDFENNINNQIELVKEQVVAREHDYECFQNMYNQLYQSNYILRKKVNEELRYEAYNLKNYEKYHILKSKAFQSANTHKNMLSDMRNFESMLIVKNEMEIEHKKKKFNELEYQVYAIKNDSEEIKKRLKILKSHRKKKLDVIQEQNNKNIKIKEENRLMLKDYLSLNIKMAGLYDGLGVTSLEEIIIKFNEQKLQYQNYHNEFIQLNQDIKGLNNIYTREKNKLKNVMNTMKIKILNEKNIKNKQNMNSALIIDDDTESSNLNMEIIDLKNKNQELKIKIINIEKILLSLFKYINEYDKKLNDILTNINFLTNIEHRAQTQLATNKEAIEFFNGKSHNFYFSLNKINPNEIKSSLKFLSKFLYKFNFILSSILFQVANDISHEKNEPKQYIKKPTQFYLIWDKQIIDRFDEYTFGALLRFENKIKILGRSEREIFRNRTNKTQKETKKELLNNKLRTNANKLLDTYLNYEKSKNTLNPEVHLLKNIKTRLQVHMLKYTNELVEAKENTNKKKVIASLTAAANLNHQNIKLKKIGLGLNRKEDYKEILSNIKKEENKRLINNNDDEDEDLDKENIDDDSYISVETEKEEVIIPPINFFGAQKHNKDMGIIFKRIDDLHKLELKHQQEKRNADLVNGQEFNQIFYNFKRKHLKKEPSISGNTINPTIKVKGLIKNNSTISISKPNNEIIPKIDKFNKKDKKRMSMSNIKNNNNNNNISNDRLIILKDNEKIINDFQNFKRKHVKTSSSIYLPASTYSNFFNNKGNMIARDNFKEKKNSISKNSIDNNVTKFYTNVFENAK